jgi:hypothetical protein
VSIVTMGNQDGVVVGWWGRRGGEGRCKQILRMLISGGGGPSVEMDLRMVVVRECVHCYHTKSEGGCPLLHWT